MKAVSQRALEERDTIRSHVATCRLGDWCWRDIHIDGGERKPREQHGWTKGNEPRFRMVGFGSFD